ncbi:MAG: FtsH protease activity modulator HflK [Acetobacteraceae bacterium]|nr:FtsH protease activity modulator HflK [Acetobacteraceae bacterium]
MSWNNGPGPWGSPGGSQGGSGSGGNGNGRRRGGGPWGGGGGPGGFPGPGQFPDLDQLIARAQAFIRRIAPGGSFGSGRGVALLAIAAAALWLVSGFYRVQPDEQGVVLRFGAYNRTALPGLNFHIPWPVESVLRPPVTRINRLEIGYGSGTGEPREAAAREIPEESQMLTGDENIIDINFAVFWRIRDTVPYLFNVRNQPTVIKAVAESAMREVIGRTPIQPALTEARAQIETEVAQAMQATLDAYAAGVEITQVQLQRVDPPAAVIDSFRDVQRANTDAERMRNEAEAYRNDIVPRARGDAARITAEADGARQASIAEATGQTQRFLSVLAAYRTAKDVTLQRMYLETMQDIMSRSPAVVVDDNLKGLVPFLPLTPPEHAAPATAQPAQPAAPSLTTPQARSTQ